ncbi:DUF4032 domain-containing protein [Corynebacterium pyruviciproducens]|uniref:DUF4032 domain-containing protein n=1 Tax=Corynebacterium pyruviciproducens TaxID=598660 RepID=A0AAF0YXT1_9CORY|nr:DUF4032 domain-containing protein [Corynebacterium pyruviciproducens]MDH4658424.1 DUF4032 domain-containing protein [Corynebacterium pyruviciproducens]MDK6564863.1 DUF4032 domain-containing protein [Corynebacterium pyruviciproducens]MDK7214838.1 DUF4032 domain-containing protein [Corynebacterium pyruviciproducens]WOT02475.1 DUF4032 domain-containing protein [Corynebacterium pyruviciproducens]
MPEKMEISGTALAPALLQLPWELPLEEWPENVLTALPRGISRHTVRFVSIPDGSSTRVIAVKEIGERVAHHEYQMLRELNRLGAPSVTPLAVITGRRDQQGEELTACLVTSHLPFSLPYRAVFSQKLRPEVAGKLIDSLAVLLVRLHLLGFFWGDVSLSNTLFRRDADAFSGYLVDAETGELAATLSETRRMYDVDVARVNIIGELMDLEAGGLMDESMDPIAIGSAITQRYGQLWEELTGEEAIAADETWRVSDRIRRLNKLGFDVGELKVVKDEAGETVTIRPQVVDSGHHNRLLMRLTGLDVQEKQARRMLNSMHTFQALRFPDLPLEQVAHKWLLDVFLPTVRSVPPALARKLEPAQIFHEILEHRWYMTEEREGDVSLEEATQSYIKSILPSHRDEETLLE